MPERAFLKQKIARIVQSLIIDYLRACVPSSNCLVRFVEHRGEFLRRHTNSWLNRWLIVRTVRRWSGRSTVGYCAIGLIISTLLILRILETVSWLSGSFFLSSYLFQIKYFGKGIFYRAMLHDTRENITMIYFAESQSVLFNFKCNVNGVKACVRLFTYHWSLLRL